VQGQILVGGFEAVHFYAWHPRCPPFHKITLPDPTFQAALRSHLTRFCDVLDQKTEQARALGAYAVMRRVETPGEIAYTPDEDQQLKIVVDGKEVPDERVQGDRGSAF
jgi:hypothetical protein